MTSDRKLEKTITYPKDWDKNVENGGENTYPKLHFYFCRPCQPQNPNWFSAFIFRTVFKAATGIIQVAEFQLT